MHSARFHSLWAVCCVLVTLPATAQEQVWIRQLGTSSYEEPRACAPDGSGGVYMAGMTGGSLGGPNAGNYDAWLARYDAAGKQTWVRQLGTSADEYANAAAPDSSGGVYVAGTTHGSLGGQTTGGADVWLARHDGNGNQLWIRQLGSSAGDSGYAVASDDSGGVYVGGDTLGNLGGPSAGNVDAWLARYDGAGNRLWSRQFGTGAGEILLAAAPDGFGGVHVAGYATGNLAGSSAGLWDVWIARYDGAGSQLWVRQLGTAFNEHPLGAAPDGSGGAYLSGVTEGDLGGPNAGDGDAWLMRLDGVGSTLWIRQLGTSDFDSAMFATSDGLDGVTVGGTTRGSLAGPHPGTVSPWLARYDGTGNQSWIRQLSASSPTNALAAASDGAHAVYVSGYTNSSLGGPNAGSADGWLARYVDSPAPFCTAKGGLACGTPRIDAIGIPSASAMSGFIVLAGPTLSCKSGLLLYNTTSLATGLPFLGGTLCVTPSQMLRAGPTSSGGTVGGKSCDGELAIDMNAFAAGVWSVPDCAGFPSGLATTRPAAYLLIAGQDVYCQFFGRDTAVTGSLVSAGLRYTIEP